MKRTERFISVFFCGLLISCVFQILIIRPSYSAAPTITSVTPDTGTTTSSTRVTISGENFEPGAKVSLLSGGPLLVDANDVYGYVHVSGKYAYVAAKGSGLKILDISNFSSPEIVGSITNIGSPGKVYLYGDYAYVTVNSDGEKYVTPWLQVVNITDPASPELAGSVAVPGSIQTKLGSIYVSGDYAYLTGSSPEWTGSLGWLTIVDISDPTSPVLVSSYNLSDNAYGVQVSGNYAYVTYVTPWCCSYFGGAGLLVIDISDPTNPVTIGSYETSGNAFDVHVSENYAYVAAGQAGLQIIDISDPRSPAFAGSLDIAGSTVKNINVSGSQDDITGSVYRVYVDGDYAYLVGEPGLFVINISDPASPVLSGYHDTRGVVPSRLPGDNRDYIYIEEFNVYVAGGYAYVTDMEGLLLIDVSNPANPAFVGTVQTPGEALSLHVADDYAYVTTWSTEEYHGIVNLAIIDISRPENSNSISSLSSLFEFPNPWASVYWDVYVAGDYAYQTFGWPPALRVVDVSDPVSPVMTGFADSNTLNNYFKYKTGSVHVSGNYAYVPFLEAGMEGGFSAWLWIVDISDPQAPVITNSVSVPGGSGVYISGPFAYVAAGGAGMIIIDINDPAVPFIVGSYDTPGSAKGVYVSGHYAYIADGTAGLSVIDISDPTAPFLAGNYDTPGPAERLHVSGHYAYLADGTAGLSVINISDPTSPFLADLVDTPHITSDVYASGGYAYLANGHSGLIVTATHDSVTGINVLNSTTITATFPADLPKGTYHVLVTNPGGQTEEAYLYNSFKAELLPASESKDKCCMKKHHHKKE